MNQDYLGGEEDHGDVLVVKTGTDFRDLSVLTLELVDTPEGSVRKKVIKTIKGNVSVSAALWPTHETKLRPREAPRNAAKQQEERARGRSAQGPALLCIFCTESACLQERSGARPSFFPHPCTRGNRLLYGTSETASVDYLPQTAAANWFADVLRHSYDDALCLKGYNNTDGVFICGGTIRGDSVYGPGKSTPSPDFARLADPDMIRQA